MTDILFRTDSHIFSYRVTGVCIQNDSVLLQKPTGDDGFAFPGGHVAFGETNEETLRLGRQAMPPDLPVLCRHD